MRTSDLCVRYVCEYDPKVSGHKCGVLGRSCTPRRPPPARVKNRWFAAAVFGAIAVALLVAEGAFYLFAEKVAEGVRSTVAGVLLLLIALAFVGALMLLAARR